MDTPQPPTDLVLRFLQAVLDDDPAEQDRLLAAAAERGAEVVQDVAECLARAHGLPDDEALELLDCANEIVFASDAPEAYETLLRDIALRVPEDAYQDIEEILAEFDAGGLAAAALPLREAAVDEDDEMLRSICAYALAVAEPGTPGVLEALLDEHERDPLYGIGHLCDHGDERAAPVLIAWLVPPEELPDLDDDVLAHTCNAAVALLDWGVELDAENRTRADAAIVAMCAHLDCVNDLLREDIAHNEGIIRELRRRGPGNLRPVGARPAPGRNRPCPCGSGKKAKLCCG